MKYLLSILMPTVYAPALNFVQILHSVGFEQFKFKGNITFVRARTTKVSVATVTNDSAGRHSSLQYRMP